MLGERLERGLLREVATSRQTRFSGGIAS
jgi:hypothetical protein